MSKNSSELLLRGTWILSLSSLITKILSAFYRVPLQNLVGNRGFFIYQQVYPLYGLCTAVALTGIPMFVSQVLAEDPINQIHNRRSLLIGALILGMIMAILLTISAQQIALWMGDVNLTPLIKVLAGFYLLAPLEAVYRGIYQGSLQMLPTAISQLSEQIIRVLIIIIAAIVFRTNYYIMGTWAHAGAGVGAIAALIALSCFHLPRSLNLTPIKKAPQHLLHRFLTEGLPLSLFGSLLVLLQTIDSFTMYKLLRAYHWVQPQVLKGIYDRAQPLAQLGIVVALSFATTMLPQLSQKSSKKQQSLIAATIHIVVTLAAYCSVGLAFLMPQINILLFKDTQQNLALSIYVLAVFFISYTVVINTIIQAQHRQHYNIILLITALFIKMVANYCLIPRWGTIGASIATLGASIILAAGLYIISGTRLRHYLWQHNFIYKLMFITLLLALVVNLFNLLWRSIEPLTRLSAIWEVGLTITAAIVLVAVLSYRLQLLTVQEYLFLPGGQLIIKKLGGTDAFR